MSEKEAEKIKKDLSLLTETYEILEYVNETIKSDDNIPADYKTFVTARILQIYTGDPKGSKELKGFKRKYNKYYKEALEFYGLITKDTQTEAGTSIEKIKREDFCYYPIDNVNREAFRNDIDFKNTKPITVRNKPKKSIYVNFYLDVFNDGIVKNSEAIKKLDGFDKLVHTAIGNIYNWGYNEVTAHQIWRIMNNGGNKNPSNEMLERIKKSIFKMASIVVKLDTKEVLEAYKDLKEIPHTGNIINISGWYKRSNNGQIVDCYKIESEPILYQYARSISQIYPVDLRLFNVPGLRNDEETLKTKAYMVERLAGLTNKSTNGLIKYDSVLKALDVDLKGSTKQYQWNKKSKLKNKLTKIAMYWKGQDVIKGFEIYGDGIELVVD